MIIQKVPGILLYFEKKYIVQLAKGKPQRIIFQHSICVFACTVKTALA